MERRSCCWRLAPPLAPSRTAPPLLPVSPGGGISVAAYSCSPPFLGLAGIFERDSIPLACARERGGASSWSNGASTTHRSDIGPQCPPTFSPLDQSCPTQYSPSCRQDRRMNIESTTALAREGSMTT